MWKWFVILQTEDATTLNSCGIYGPFDSKDDACVWWQLNAPLGTKHAIMRNIETDPKEREYR
jgi:hypothetical protein